MTFLGVGEKSLLVEPTGCLKKIEKIAYSIVLGVISLSRNIESRDFEQYLVWLGLNSHLARS